MRASWLQRAAATAIPFTLACIGPVVEPPAAEPPADAPRLLLLVVIDQLGGDHLTRFDPVLTGGLRRLLDDGVSFREAHHAHAGTTTSPGHATIATGCHPAQHGIISNYWYDRRTGESVYSVEDERYEGTPERMECSTLGDWLKDRYPASRVISLSAKDRAAVLTAGRRADGAYWYGWDGTFTSSGYYGDSEPKWLSDSNAEGFLASQFGKVWTPLPVAAEELARMGVVESDLGPLEEDFPHPIGGLSLAPGEYFFADLFKSPWMDEYILRLARRAVLEESLGQDAFPDLLGLVFSTSDSVGHAYGPESREFFDIVLRLDRQLGDFFDWLDETVGMDKVAIALTSDHGSVPVPELRSASGLPGARVGAAEIACLQSIDAALDEEFGEAVWFHPGPFFTPLPAGGDLDPRTVHRRAQSLLEACPSVEKVWLAEDLAAAPVGDLNATGAAVDDGLAVMREKFARSYFPERSPDLEIQWREFFLGSQGNASSHGTPYRYDTHVPLIFLRSGMGAAVETAPVRTVDVAPTLASWVGIDPPPAVAGRSLLPPPASAP